MMTRTFLSAAMLLPALAWQAAAAPPLFSEHVPAAVRNDFRMVWHDEFDGNALDPANWKVRGEGTFPDDVRFDYVRVYQKK